MEILLAWRCSLPDQNIREFLDGFQEAIITPTRPKRHPGVTSFNVALEDGDRESSVRNVLAFLRRNAAKLRQLSELGGQSEIDFGVLVGSDEHDAPNIVFEPAFLNEVAASGVQLRVSAYPTSDE